MSSFKPLLLCSLLLSLAGTLAAASSAPLRPHGRTELPGYSGDFDHFAVDVTGKRLFLAAEDHGTLEVFDLSSGKHLKTIDGVETPHGIIYLAKTHRLIVSDSGPGLSKIFDASSYKLIDTIKLQPGADSMTYDPVRKHAYIVTGGKNGNLADSWIAKVDARTGKTLGELKFDTDKVEALAVEQRGKRLFVNVTGRNEVAVIDKNALRIIDTWPVQDGQMNAAMAFDEGHHRLFIVTRKPFQLLVMDSRNGATIARFPAPERTNEVIYDKRNRRIYLAGDDYLGVVQQVDANHYSELPHVPTATGAKTAIFVPELNRLYSAVSPGEGKTGAAVLRFDAASGATR